MADVLIGAIGDDVTGSTDLALMLSKHGMSVVQTIGLPRAGAVVHDAQAAVVALKSRTAPVGQAVADSLAACDWQLAQGARQIFFKYCSTFDSTEQGNIGPVAEALMGRLGAEIAIYCPAFPENGRSVYNGHLFVGRDLLSDSGMRHHPLTPMTDSNLVRFLGRQVRDPETVALVSYETVDRGPAAIRDRLQELAGRKCRHAVVDALTNRHLAAIGEACADLKLVTGGSGVAMGLPLNFRRANLLGDMAGTALLPRLDGGIAALAGSCSAATRRQVKRMSARFPSIRIDPQELASGTLSIEDVARWAAERVGQTPVLIYSTAEPEQVAAVQAQLGREAAGHLVEQAMGQIALLLRQAGVRTFIVAGGETAGAVMAALSARSLRIGPEIAPGVPWTVTEEEPRLCLALKSGNFGDEDFFEKAVRMLP
jgi:3-dehydrotetronate 4-kinase